MTNEASSQDAATELLVAWGAGDATARDRMLPLVYDELRRIAAAYFGCERVGHTFQTTALVHEPTWPMEASVICRSFQP